MLPSAICPIAGVVAVALTAGLSYRAQAQSVSDSLEELLHRAGAYVAAYERDDETIKAP